MNAIRSRIPNPNAGLFNSVFFTDCKMKSEHLIRCLLTLSSITINVGATEKTEVTCATNTKTDILVSLSCPRTKSGKPSYPRSIYLDDSSISAKPAKVVIGCLIEGEGMTEIIKW